jgi:hypothetical protein
MDKRENMRMVPAGNNPDYQSVRLAVLFASRVLAASAAGESERALKLSKKQKTEIRAILEVEGERVRLLASQLTKNSRQLQVAIAGSPANADALQPLSDQRKQIESELQVIKELLMKRISEVLTIRQRSVLQAA